MLISTSLSQRVRALALACALSATMVAMSAPLAHAEEGAIESPFTKVEGFADDIRDYVGSVADEATEKAEREAARKQRKADRRAIVSEAKEQLGVPYVYGGTTPVGFDCSGFTRWVYEHALGRTLPRTAAEQSTLGKGVSLDSLVPGDLLFWGSAGNAYHVGIYVGGGEYIHASTGGGRVMKVTFDYYAPDFARRIL